MTSEESRGGKITESMPTKSKAGAMRKTAFWGLSPFWFTFLTSLVILILGTVFLISQVYIFVRADRKDVQVPDFSGMDVEEAQDTADDLKLKIRLDRYEYSDDIGKNRITSQIPSAGSTIKEGRIVYLYVSLGKRDIAVPNVIGMKIDDARLEIENAGLTSGTPQGKYSDKSPENTIISQEPPPGVLLATGESIQLTYSKGPARRSIDMPDLKGLTPEEALREMDNLGLKVSRITRTYKNSASKTTVTGQAPPAGRLVKRGSEVILDLTLPIHKKKIGEREFRVVVMVPESDHGIEVRIIKKDLKENKEVYREVIKGPARVEKMIEAYGATTVSIYFDGRMERQETF